MITSLTRRLVLLRSQITSLSSTKYLSTVTPTAKTVMNFEKLAKSDKITETLENWVKEGKVVERQHMVFLANQLRKSNKFNQANQIYEWMEKSNYDVKSADRVTRIDLLSRTEGLASAEKYFDSLQDSEKTKDTYGALLRCYCQEKKLDQASNLFEKMKEEKAVRRGDIFLYANLLRHYKKYNQAKQIYDWIDQTEYKMKNADCATRIALLAKTDGLESAEKYFDSLQESLKTTKTYGTLLHCYCNFKKLDKALSLFEKMNELNCTSTFSYNSMMTLYASIRKPEKIPLLAEKMEEKNITADQSTYNQLLRSYATMKKFDALDRVVEKMKTNKVECDWFTLGNLARIYVDAGDVAKATTVLRDMEKLENMSDLDAYHKLITLYGRTSDVSGVKRSWDSLKLVFPKPSNGSYLIMLLALSNLGEVDALEKCFKTWESDCSDYDIRIVNVILESYLKREMIKEAELVYENIVKSGTEPNARTYEALTNYYIKKQEIDLALKFLEIGVSKANLWKRNWFPSTETIKMFRRYFEEENDLDRVQKFCNCLKMIQRLDPKVYNSVLNKKVGAGKLASLMSSK